MLIKKRRIHNLGLYLSDSLKDKTLIIANPVSNVDINVLAKLGFVNHTIGETVLPKPVGPVSRFNAEGKFVIHRDQEMETAYRQAEWTWKEWSGRDDYVERSKIVDIPYKRYPRSLIKPPSVELQVVKDLNGELLLSSSAIAYTDINLDSLKHRINLHLELFGECIVLDASLNAISVLKIIRLNWTILPVGERPWEQIKGQVSTLVDTLKPMKRRIAYTRLDVIEKYNPDFVAIGTGGFSGYLIFGFQDKSLYFFESINYGNATYVFEGNWEQLSKLTKAEILTDSLQKHRLIHLKGWALNVHAILG